MEQQYKPVPQEPKLRPEEMPEYQDKLSQYLIKDWRERLGYSDERIIQALRIWG